MQRKLEIETPEAVAFAYPLAGLGSRGMAAMIDTIMLGLIIGAEGSAAFLAVTLLGRVAGDLVGALIPWIVGAFIIIAFATYWSYFIVGEVFRNGRTLGKRIMRIRVVREDGSRVGVLESVIRNVVRIIDMMPGTYGFGILSVWISPRAQRLGDMAAGTVVIEEPPRLVELDVDARGELASLVRDYLNRRGYFSPEARWQVGVSLLAAYAEQPQSGWDEPTVAGRLADLSGMRS